MIIFVCTFILSPIEASFLPFSGIISMPKIHFTYCLYNFQAAFHFAHENGGGSMKFFNFSFSKNRKYSVVKYYWEVIFLQLFPLSERTDKLIYKHIFPFLTKNCKLPNCSMSTTTYHIPLKTISAQTYNFIKSHFLFYNMHH